MPGKSDRIPLGVWVAKPLKAHLDALALKDQKTLTVEVTNAIEAYLKQRGIKLDPVQQQPEAPQ